MKRRIILIGLVLCVMAIGAGEVYAGGIGDVIKKINKQAKRDFEHVTNQAKRDFVNVTDQAKRDFQNTNEQVVRTAEKSGVVPDSVINSFKHFNRKAVRGYDRVNKQAVRTYDDVNDQAVRDFDHVSQEVERTAERVDNEAKRALTKGVKQAAKLSEKAYKPVSKAMDKVVSTQPKAVREFYKKYPATTTLVMTGDSQATSAVYNAKKFENPDSERAGVDGFLSGTYINNPAEYHAGQFLSGASGEKVDGQGLENYGNRVVVGSLAGAGKGATVGHQYGGSWGALGGAIGGAANGAWLGSMTPEQSDNTVDRLLLGKSAQIEKDSESVSWLGIPNGPKDARTTNRAAWEGRDGDFLGETHQQYGEEMASTWGKKLFMKTTGLDVKAKEGGQAGMEVLYEKTGIDLRRFNK